MSGGGSKKGRKLAKYRRSNFWPRQAKEAELDAAFMAWPVTGMARIVARYFVRNDMRFAL